MVVRSNVGKYDHSGSESSYLASLRAGVGCQGDLQALLGVSLDVRGLSPFKSGYGYVGE
jgi:hypothetical protein